MNKIFKMTTLFLASLTLAACSLSSCNPNSSDDHSGSSSVGIEEIAPELATLHLKSSLDKIRDAESYRLDTDFSSGLAMEVNENDVVSTSDFSSTGDISIRSITEERWTNQIIKLDGEGLYTDENDEETEVGFGFDIYQYEGQTYLNLLQSAELFTLFNIPMFESRIQFQLRDLIDEIIQLLKDNGILDPNDPVLDPIDIDIFDLLPTPTAQGLGSFMNITYELTKEALVHLFYGVIMAQQGTDILSLDPDEVATTETALLTELSDVRVKYFTLEFRITKLDGFVHFKIDADITNTTYQERYEENSERIMTRYRQHMTWSSTTVLTSINEPLDIRFPSNLGEYITIDIGFLLDLLNGQSNPLFSDIDGNNLDLDDVIQL